MAVTIETVSRSTQNTLRLIGIYKDLNFLIGEFQRHPELASILSVSDVLTSIGVKNRALKVSIDQLVDCNFPLIAQTKDRKTITVSKIVSEKIYFSHIDKEEVLSLSKFEKEFSGLVLCFSDQSIAVTTKRSRYLFPSLQFTVAKILLAIILSILAFQHIRTSFSVDFLVLLVLSTSGFLLTQDLALKPFISGKGISETICGLNSKQDCNALIESKYSKITSWLSVSELAFFFYSGSLFLLFSSIHLNEYSFILKVLTFISMPFLLFSIFIQGFVYRSWCFICCLIICLFTAEFLYFLFIIKSPFLISLKSVLIFCLPSLAWLSIKPFLSKIKSDGELSNNYNSKRNNREIFERIFYANGNIDCDKNIGITLGNNQSRNCLTIVTSPFCAPCREVHKEVEQWLSWNETLKVQLVFCIDPEDTRSDKLSVIRHIIALNASNKYDMGDVINEFYSNVDPTFEGWKLKYPIEYRDEDLGIIKSQYDWCRIQKITGTPTIFLNNIRISKFYEFKDLKYLLYK